MRHDMKDGSGVRLNFRVRSTMDAGPGAPLDAEDGDGDAGRDEEPSAPGWFVDLVEGIRENAEAVDRLKRELDGRGGDAGADLGFEPVSTMNAGPGRPLDEAVEEEDVAPDGGGLGFEVRSTMGAGPGSKR